MQQSRALQVNRHQWSERIQPALRSPNYTNTLRISTNTWNNYKAEDTTVSLESQENIHGKV